MTLEEARRHRKELKKTRKYAAHVDSCEGVPSPYEREFSLCEH